MLIVTFTWNWIEWGQMCRLHYSGHILCILCSENKPRQKIQKCPLFARVFMEICSMPNYVSYIHSLFSGPGSIWPFHWVSEGLGGQKNKSKLLIGVLSHSRLLVLRCSKQFSDLMSVTWKAQLSSLTPLCAIKRPNTAHYPNVKFV